MGSVDVLGARNLHVYKQVLITYETRAHAQLHTLLPYIGGKVGKDRPTDRRTNIPHRRDASTRLKAEHCNVRNRQCPAKLTLH